MKKITAIIIALLLVCSIVVPVTMSATNSGSKAFTNLYNGNTYVEHGNNTAHSVTYDNTAKAVVMPNSQKKARINYSTNLSTFEASTVLQGNSSGQIWAGIAFRIQESDFTTAAFNTAGYSAYVIRKSAEKNKATIMFRYCTAGAAKKEINTSMTTALPTNTDLKLRFDVAVKSDNKAYIKLLSADGATQYGNTLEFNLDARTEYTGTSYYDKGAIALISNGINTFTNLSITTTDNITIPAEDMPQTNPLADKYNLFGADASTDSNNYTTSTGVSRGTLKTGSANDFSTELTIKLNADAETKTGIIFRASAVGDGQNDMKGYAAVLDTTKDDFARVYLYKYGPKTNETANSYLGRIGDILIDQSITVTAGTEIVLHLNVKGDKAEAYIYEKSAPSATKSDVLTVDLKSTTDGADNGLYYETGDIGYFIGHDGNYDSFLANVTEGLVIKAAEDIGSGSGPVEPTLTPNEKLAQKYNLFGKTPTTDQNNYTTSTGVSRGTLKIGSANDFSTEMTVKLNSQAETKTGIIFRASNIGDTANDMQGYALVVDTTRIDYMRLFIYKYGKKPNEANNDYLGRIGKILDVNNMDIAAGKEFVLHLNVNGQNAQGYIYDKADPSIKSGILSVDLSSATDQDYDNGLYYETGDIGYFIGTQKDYGDFLVNALDGLVINPAEDNIGDGGNDEGDRFSGGIAATDDSRGSAVKGDYSSVGNVNASNAGISGKTDLEAYAADFDNYTFYSSSATNRFILEDGCIVSKSAGAKRAMLDGVSVKGFHAAATMKVTDEGTMRSGIVFRINNIENGVKKDGTLAANDIEGYAAILYKTPGTTESYARVVMCVYKYGIVNGKYTYLGTVASKASDVPLKAFEKEQKAAAGQLITMDVNVIDDQLTMYFYNEANPELKSESLITELTSDTDVEKNTPSLKGVHYKSGAIGLTATDHAIFTKFTVGEPVYPSNEVGDLSDLDSYIVYGSGVKQEGEYITSNSSGTKKVMVKNLTVKDFKASVDMTIDENGNLKSGFFFRTNDMANAADDQTGWAIIVTRNFSTNGETNPNRIDIVLFKWGYSKGKLSYLGEVSREVYKSGHSFVDGKMAGEELTFVVQVQGAGIDATLYKKDEPTKKPVTFSSNLKFAGSKEKDELAYYESGSIGLYLGNSVADPVNYNRLRNFRIDDGSGVLVKPMANSLAKKSAVTVLGVPVTGESAVIFIVAVAFVVSAIFMVVTIISRKKGKHSIGDSKE